MKGSSFLSDEKDTLHGSKRHLNIIITNPDEENNFLVVPVTTWREKDGKPYKRQDTSCILESGSHPFIKHKSWIFYAYSRSMSMVYRRDY